MRRIITSLFLIASFGVTAQEIFNEMELRSRMKQDGLSEAMINKLIADRKAWMEKGKSVEWNSFKKNQPVLPAGVSDMGGEGGWNAWQGDLGASGSCTITMTPPAVNPPATPNFYLTSGTGVDPCTPGPVTGSPTIPLVSPGFGSASIGVGEPQATGCVVDQLTYVLPVTVKDTLLLVSYALIIQDAGHANCDQPYVQFSIWDQNGDTIPCALFKFVGGPNLPGFYLANCSFGVYYKPWTMFGVHLANYVGQTVTIEINNVDCSQCGHFAHSYWDFQSGVIDRHFCSTQPDTLCLPTPANGTVTYQWYQNGNQLTNDTLSCLPITAQHGDTFMVHVMSPSGCNYSVQYNLLDTCLASGMAEFPVELVSIYPNPSSGSVVLDFGVRQLGPTELIITNLVGLEIRRTSMDARGKKQLDLSELPSGVYFISLYAESGWVTKKLTISR